MAHCVELAQQEAQLPCSPFSSHSAVHSGWQLEWVCKHCGVVCHVPFQLGDLQAEVGHKLHAGGGYTLVLIPNLSGNQTLVSMH